MKVEISNLTFKAIIGILPKERIKKQTVIVDLSFEYDFVDGEFVDYSKVADTVKITIQEQKFELIEDALLHLQTILNAKFKIQNLTLKISKPTILKDCVVSVAIN